MDAFGVTLLASREWRRDLRCATFGRNLLLISLSALIVSAASATVRSSVLTLRNTKQIIVVARSARIVQINVRKVLLATRTLRSWPVAWRKWHSLTEVGVALRLRSCLPLLVFGLKFRRRKRMEDR